MDPSKSTQAMADLIQTYADAFRNLSVDSIDWVTFRNSARRVSQVKKLRFFVFQSIFYSAGKTAHRLASQSVVCME